MPGPGTSIDFVQRLKEIDLFFEGRGKQHRTMRRLVQNLDKAGIAYAIVGGMAVNAHGHERTTKDVDILLTADGFNAFRKRFVPKSYDPVEGYPRRFWDRRHQCSFDILVTGLFPGSGKPGPISYPDPSEVSEIIQEMHVVNLSTLIQLKLAARRHGDFYDVHHLIRAHDLDEKFLKKLHPAVRQDFIECLEEKRREDEYEVRQNRMLEKKLKELERDS
ncbi:MAG: nucleotidyl transferase AbiEii/AbiGii toxin family protein [Planctomycetia bacterium]|nr:nucleotidyl transferase AbiEii/AbiGii toxin family protein [Planctomycetia bacterium]